MKLERSTSIGEPESNDESIEISVVIPVKDEEDSLAELADSLTQVLSTIGRPHELIFVDDGSCDASFEVMRDLHQRNPHVRVLRFRRNFGKAAALKAGFDQAKGEVILTIDADLQDDPNDIPGFLEQIDRGYDLVSGWKQVRRDPLTKTLPSRLFNRVTSALAGIRLHDFNCGFKAYRREVVTHIHLYGELHRYIPVLAHWKGFKVGEMVVEHHARRFGRSKYGYRRLPKGFFDLITILFTRKYGRRPLHIFGFLGLILGFLGAVAIGYLVVLWFLGHRPIGNRPLLFLGILAVLFGTQLVSFGVVTEMLAKIEDRYEAGYVISERLL